MISILSWLGISSQTMWDDLTDADALGAADSVAQLCAHFLDDAPGWLQGLAPPDLSPDSL